ncbi:hypothetical protein GCM10022242_39990 [Nocardioides panacisoli]|uniref:DUF2157 domain-containing protein n=2 Tax=Nocardioides panacisoli TaxID=627624 RepID=A0ABP7J5R3_9ACTN
MRYADPALCPDCRSDLTRGVDACPTCGLVLRHPLAVELFGTLHHADDLVAALRVASTTPAGPVPAQAAAPAPSAAPPGLPVVPPLPPLPPVRSGIGFGWVPKILLGLGALFLLVAAITFLAVAWSHLGVGGRTAVLLAFTGAAGAAALLLHRFDLRVAGESLIVVALGLLGLDVVGAGTAGWFGHHSNATIATATGIVLFAAGTATGLLRVAGRPRLVAPQVIAGIGLATADLGSLGITSHGLLASHTWVLLGGAAAVLARRTGLPALAWSTAGAAGLAWTIGILGGLTLSLENPTFHELWVDGTGWSLLASAAALVVPGLVLRDRELVRWGTSAAALVVTGTLAVPCVDTSARTIELVALLITMGWTAALALLPRLLRPAAIAPAAIGAILLAALQLVTAGIAVERWWHAVERPVRAAGDHFGGAAAVTEPLLTVPSLLVVLVAVALLLPADSSGRRAWPTWAAAGGLVAGAGGAVTIASYDVPVLYAVIALVLTAVAASLLALAADGGRQLGFGLAALGAAAAAVATGIAWPVLAAAAAAAALAVTGALHLRARSTDLRVLAGLLVPVSLATLVEAVAAVVALDEAWRAVPVLASVGVLAIARARVEIEVPAALAGTLCAVPAIAEAADPAGSLALHLTVAGFLVAATALVNDHRRDAAWAGGALLFLASWVRLADLGVHAPEPYTLPLAAALLGIGVWRLRESPEATTAATLTPGLLLATVPSLLWMLDEPTSLRALLLGLGAVAMAVTGSALRWSAPLVVGACVGAAIVLRELGPYAGDAPAWAWMGLGGALLVVVGVTWERRLLEVRHAVGLLGRLR